LLAEAEALRDDHKVFRSQGLTAEPPRIVYLSHTADLYGAERSLATLVIAQRRGDLYRPRVVVPTDGPLVKVLREADVEVRVWRFGYWLRWRPRRFDRLLAVATLLDCLLGAARLAVSLRRQRPVLNRPGFPGDPIL
jgi:hypothetical protein